MKTRLARSVAPALTACLIMLTPAPSSAQPETIEADLPSVINGTGWKVFNRSVTLIDHDGRPAVRFDDQSGTGGAIMENVNLGNGTIEFDARGKNIRQRSYLGVAFHGVGDQTYDAVYFRPFLFRADDPVGRQRAVQYVSMPAHPWRRLREEFPGKYETSVVPVPDPDGWFHVRLVIAWPKVSVFVNDAKEPCLAVDQLSDRKQGWIALWVDVAGGDFANLKITPAP